MVIVKRISDPVHGSIGLTELELKIVNSPAFQRLRRIKQLGLANLAFPSADYSRFAHSLGVCHIAGRFLECLSHAVDASHVTLYRLAALVHDIGHYPYSHSFEHALDHLTRTAAPVRQDDTIEFEQTESQAELPYLDHELVCREVLLHDPEIVKILQNGPSAEEIHAVLVEKKDEQQGGRVGRPFLANIVSSDLDADRLDYLSRTSCHTGLPYGVIDLEYLVNQIEINAKDGLCFNAKAVRTIEHMLLSRWIEFEQVVFNKTVVAFEHMLNDLIIAVVQQDPTRFEPAELPAAIAAGQWYDYDDAWLDREISRLVLPQTSTVLSDYRTAIQERKPPHFVTGNELLLSARSQGRIASFKAEVAAAREIAKQFELSQGLPHGTVFVCERTKPKGIVTFDTQKREKAVKVIWPGQTAAYLDELPNTLLSMVGRCSLYNYHVFILRLPEFQASQQRKRDLSRIFAQELPATVGAV